MKTIEIDCFEILSENGKNLGYCATELVGKIYTQGSPYMDVRPFKKTFNIASSAQELHDLDTLALRNAALSKLTPAERKLLGFV